MIRTIAIWFFGVVASALIGGLIAERLQPFYTYDAGPWGALAGICAFACIRLWVGKKSAKNSN